MTNYVIDYMIIKICNMILMTKFLYNNGKNINTSYI